MLSIITNTTNTKLTTFDLYFLFILLIYIFDLYFEKSNYDLLISLRYGLK